jgi:hypothetical protein
MMQLKKSDNNLCADDFKSAILVPPFKPGYSIMFATLDFFVFVKRFIMIYERFIIAKQQIADKVVEDINNFKTLDSILKESKASLSRD